MYHTYLAGETAVEGGSKHTDSTNPGLKAGSYPTICVYKKMLQVFYFVKRTYLKSGRRNHCMVKYFGTKKIDYKCMDHFRRTDLWTPSLVINEMNQMALLSIFLYQFSIFYISTKNVLLEFCIDIWGYDKHSLSVLMPSQIESPEAEGYWAVNNQEI